MYSLQLLERADTICLQTSEVYTTQNTIDVFVQFFHGRIEQSLQPNQVNWYSLAPKLCTIFVSGVIFNFFGILIKLIILYRVFLFILLIFAFVCANIVFVSFDYYYYYNLGMI